MYELTTEGDTSLQHIKEACALVRHIMDHNIEGQQLVTLTAILLAINRIGDTLDRINVQLADDDN